MNNQLVVYAVSIHDADSFGFFVKKLGNGVLLSNNINDAKIWKKIGPARSMVTSYTKETSKYFPNVTPPKLVKVISTEIEFIDESERVNKVISSTKNKEALHEERIAKIRLKNAEEKFADAKRNLDKLKKDVF